MKLANNVMLTAKNHKRVMAFLRDYAASQPDERMQEVTASTLQLIESTPAFKAWAVMQNPMYGKRK